MKKILFIQHAGDLGGSAISMRELLKEFRKDNFVSLLLIRPNNVLFDFYSDLVNNILTLKKFTTFEHTTAKSLHLYNFKDFIKLLMLPYSIIESIFKSVKFIKKNNYDIFYLNSVVLVSFAIALILLKKKFVWHIREYPVSGYLGIRKCFLKKILLSKYATVLFLTKSYRNAWLNDKKGIVVKNYYDKNIFDCKKYDLDKIKRTYNLPKNKKIIIYVGGRQKLKGIWDILAALDIVVNKFKLDVICLMPGLKNDYKKSLLKETLVNILLKLNINIGTYYIEKYINKKNLNNNCFRLLFSKNIAELISISEFLVFPAIKPHFARPIMEAGALKVPSIGTNIDGVKELIEDGETGFLYSKGNYLELAFLMKEFLENSSILKLFGERSFEKMNKEYNRDNEISRLRDIFEIIF